MHVLAADIGGTSIRAAVVSPAGQVVARLSGPTDPERGIDDAARRLTAMLAEVRDGAGDRPVALGVSTAGPLDPSTGTYLHPPNLTGWHGRTMKPALESALGLPVVIGHDATLAAMAETRFGAGIGVRDLIYVTISTGIGGGIVANGRPVTGAHGGAGEVGHIIVQPGGPSCGAGCRGCLEGVASGPSIVAAAQSLLADGRESTLRSLDDAGTLTTAGVLQAAGEGDPVAREILDSALRGLGIGIAGLLAALDPALVVLGGGVVQGLAAHWDELLEAVRAQALPRYAEGVPLVRTTLGDDISLLGAAVIAFEAAGGETADRAR
jgi:glucokinase